MQMLTFCFTALPKEHTVFRFTVPLPSTAEPQKEGQGENQEKSTPSGSKPLVFELHGSQFENRPVDRANKKFKWRNIDYV